jgi:hypothetical protein
MNIPNSVNVNNSNTNVIQVVTLGPAGPPGPQGPPGSGSITSVSASYALTASFAATASYLENYIAPFPFTGSATITGSLIVTGSLDVTQGITGSLLGTSSFALQTTSASFAISSSRAVSSSFATSASFAISSSRAVSASFAATASYFSGSIANAISASYALTASYLDNYVPPFPFTGSAQITGSLGVTGSLNVTAGITGSLLGTASYATNALTASFANNTTSASYALTASYAATSSITYVSSSNLILSEIEVADFDNNVAVTYVNGRLKFIFGSPTIPSAPVASFNSTFLTDRFNAVTDDYTVTGTITVNGYTLISASLFEGAILLANTGSGATSLIFNTTTTGSHTYSFQVTASSPLDGTLNQQAVTLTGTLNKVAPGAPTITPTATVQLGATSNQIEQGATGSITFTSASGASNGWVPLFTTSSLSSPILVIDSLTGSLSISTSATSYYSSSGIGGSDNNPPLTTTSTNSFTYTKIRSLRYGASTSSSFTSNELENLALWDTTLGGNIGTISKGTTTASGQSLTITWTSDKFHYIVYNSSLPNLTNITTGGFGVLSSFTLTTVGNYKVYKSNTLQAGGAGTSITYLLT